MSDESVSAGAEDEAISGGSCGAVPCRQTQLNVNELKEGDVLYKPASYFIVQTCSEDRTFVRSQDTFTGEVLSLSTSHASNLASATQFNEERKVTLTDLNERIATAGRLPFTVTYTLKAAPKQTDLLSIVDSSTIVDDKAKKTLVSNLKNALTVGKEHTLVCCLLTDRQTQGYWKVKDLCIVTSKKDNIRQVDSRTVQSLIIGGVKFIVGSPDKNPRLECKNCHAVFTDRALVSIVKVEGKGTCLCRPCAGIRQKDNRASKRAKK